MAESTERDTEDAGRMNIHQRIVEARRRVKGFIEKDGRVTSGTKVLYEYISHDAVTDHIRETLNDLDVAVWPSVSDRKDNGNKVSLKIDLDFVCADDPDDHKVITVWGDGVDTGDKACGKAESYAVKTAYLKVMLLNSADDQGGEVVEHDPVDPRASDAERAKEQARQAYMKAANDLQLAIRGCSTVRELVALQRDNKDALMEWPDVTREHFATLFDERKKELEQAA